MNNNIKKFFVLAMALATSFALCARPGPGGRGPGGHGGGPRGGGRGPAPMHHGGHHHHHAGRGAAIGAGVLGAGLLAGAIIDATRPHPVVVDPPPPPAPAPAPVVVTPAPVVTSGHYETRVQNVWVEGRYINQATPHGTVIRVWQPGHYEQQSTQVWVP